MTRIFSYDFPIGRVAIVACEKGIRNIWLSEERAPKLTVEELPVHKQAKEQLDLYFAGKLKEFTLPINVAGTDFQTRVWQATSAIPYGEVRTYKQIAQAAKSPKAYRAVGTAVGSNPVPIICPCHRVVGSNGIGGFAYPIERKKQLLQLEQENI